MKKEFKIAQISELEGVADYIISLTDTNFYFCFNAEMGAGKTTLINLIAKKMGVEEQTSSPTYSIVNEYLTNTNKTIYHFDLYRIESEMELFDIGIEEIIESKNSCFIEWPEKMLNFLPDNYVEINIKLIDNTRIFEITH